MPLGLWYANNRGDEEKFEKWMRRKVHYVIQPAHLWNSIANLARMMGHQEGAHKESIAGKQSVALPHRKQRFQQPSSAINKQTRYRELPRMIWRMPLSNSTVKTMVEPLIARPRPMLPAPLAAMLVVGSEMDLILLGWLSKSWPLRRRR